jgi:Domain of unknown function (DUF4129)
MSSSGLAIKKPIRFRLNARAEFRRALLAAAETCWVYAIVLTLTALAHPTNLVSPFSIFFTYWVALEIGRYLPRLRRARSVLQWINLALAVLVLLFVVRVDLYRGAPLLDLTWLPTYLGRLSALFASFTPEQTATIALVFVYIRGVGFAQRPLTLWFTGFQFRLGVVFFFGTAIVGAFTGGVDLRGLIVVYFVVSLLTIALARMEESGREMALGKAWAPLLGGASLLVVALGFFVTPLLTTTAAAAFFQILAPLAPVVEFILRLILIPLSYIIEAIIEFLIPILSVVIESMRRLPLDLIPQVQEPLQTAANQGTTLFASLWPYIRLLLFLMIVMGAALIVAHALNRQMMRVEEEDFIREAAGERERKRAEKMRRPHAAPLLQYEIEAENIRRMYAALLARCQAIGLPRREAETPFEFLPRLKGHFPQAASDLSALTEAYVAVHYAQTPATGAQVRAMRSVWRRLRGQLRATGEGGRKTNPR